MKKIKKLVKQIDEEICSAKDYAEKYLDLKAKNSMAWANKYKEMANDELRHAMNIHDYAIQEIEVLRTVYTPPEDMEQKWEHEHKEYVEDVAWIKQMLLM